jgi:hypothetical protein
LPVLTIKIPAKIAVSKFVFMVFKASRSHYQTNHGPLDYTISNPFNQNDTKF